MQLAGDLEERHFAPALWAPNPAGGWNCRFLCL